MGRKLTEATKIKIAIANSTGKKPSCDVLEDMYINKKLSTLEIGKILDVSSVTVAKWLRSYGIRLRSLREASYGNTRALGHTLSDECRAKISKSHTGKTLSYKHRVNISKKLQSNFGVIEWSGFAKDEGSYARQRFTSVFRKKVLSRDNYTCVICETVGGRLHVEHIEPWSKNPDKRFDLNNCVTLCIACHYKKTFGREYHEGATNWGNTKPIIIGSSI